MTFVGAGGKCPEGKTAFPSLRGRLAKGTGDPSNAPLVPAARYEWAGGEIPRLSPIVCFIIFLRCHTSGKRHATLLKYETRPEHEQHQHNGLFLAERSDHI